jgi:general stress protein 26
MTTEAEKLLKAKLTNKMPSKELEDHIAQFLKTQNMCVMASCKDNIPRATPLEYYSHGTTLYVMPTEGQKMENIRHNRIVSVAVFAPYVNWLSVKGVQISGEAILVTQQSKEFKDALAVYKWEKSAKEIGVSKLPTTFKLLKIVPHAIEVLDISLKSKGYAPRQMWSP